MESGSGKCPRMKENLIVSGENEGGYERTIEKAFYSLIIDHLRFRSILFIPGDVCFNGMREEVGRRGVE